MSELPAEEKKLKFAFFMALLTCKYFQLLHFFSIREQLLLASHQKVAWVSCLTLPELHWILARYCSEHWFFSVCGYGFPWRGSLCPRAQADATVCKSWGKSQVSKWTRAGFLLLAQQSWPGVLSRAQELMGQELEVFILFWYHFTCKREAVGLMSTFYVWSVAASEKDTVWRLRVGCTFCIPSSFS